MKEKVQNSVELDIPSRWKRIEAYFIDWMVYFVVLIISRSLVEIHSFLIMIVLFIANLVFIIRSKTSIWNRLVWISALNKNNTSITWWQAILRYFVFNPSFLRLLLFIVIVILAWILMWTIVNKKLHIEDFDTTSSELWIFLVMVIGIIFLFISLIEICFNCPTFIDRLLWIKRVYKKSE